MAARLREHYVKTVVPALTKEFGYKNPMAVPKIEKISINIGLGEATQNAKLMDGAVNELGQIAGQKPESSQQDAVDEEQAAAIAVDVILAGVRGEGLPDADAVGPVHGNAPKDERQREGGQEETEAAMNEDGWNDHIGSSRICREAPAISAQSYLALRAADSDSRSSSLRNSSRRSAISQLLGRIGSRAGRPGQASGTMSWSAHASTSARKRPESTAGEFLKMATTADAATNR